MVWCTSLLSITLWNMAILGQFLRVTGNFIIAGDRLGEGMRKDATALTLEGFQLMLCHWVGWCTVPWSRSLFEMVMLGHFFVIQWMQRHNKERPLNGWSDSWLMSQQSSVSNSFSGVPNIYACSSARLCRGSNSFLITHYYRHYKSSAVSLGSPYDVHRVIRIYSTGGLGQYEFP